MKVHTSGFKSAIKTFGRELDSKITYEEDGDTIELGSKGKVFMVYLVRQTENLYSDGGDAMKLVALVIKWIFDKLKKKKQPQNEIAISINITNIHKD